MKCPKCGSTDTKKVSVLDPQWSVGHERCKSCGHQDHWLHFSEDSEAKTLVQKLGMKPNEEPR